MLIWNNLKVNEGTVLLLPEKPVFTDTSVINFVDFSVYIYGYRELSDMSALKVIKKNCHKKKMGEISETNPGFLVIYIAKKKHS